MVGEGLEGKIAPLEEALSTAKRLELDLVEISPNAEPPVCKIIDYKKFVYDQKKRQKSIKSKAQNYRYQKNGQKSAWVYPFIHTWSLKTQKES